MPEFDKVYFLQPAFRLVWHSPPRTTTKNEWKKVCQYLRLCRRIIEMNIGKEKLKKHLVDTMIDGIGFLEIL